MAEPAFELRPALTYATHDGVALQGVHVGDSLRIEGGKPRNLLLDDRVGTPRLPGEGDDQRRFELVEMGRAGCAGD